MNSPRATVDHAIPLDSDTLHGVAVDTKQLHELKKETTAEPPTQRLAALTVLRPRRPIAEVTVGRQLGPYRLLRQIGRGAKGLVYVADDLALNRRVAVKVLDPEMAARGPAWVERFLQEARVASGIDHPLVLSLYSVGQEAGVVFYAMPLMPGGSTRDVLKAKGPFSAREATRVMQQAAQAIAAIHAQGLSHGNLKPSNVFVAESGEVKIADFAVTADRPASAVATDLRLLGATYHWLLAGRPPVDPDNLAGAAIPPACARIIAKAMSRRRGFASASELADALADVLTSEAELRAPCPHEVAVAIPDSEGRIPHTGEVLGKCLLLERIGQGAAGVVFRARHQTLNIPVAVKMLQVTGESGIYRQFRSEARLLAQLNHPHVVRVWDFEDDPALPYMVMEYVAGPDLADVLNEHGRLPAGRAVQIVAQIADGLAAAQRLGIVHRDVKPANIVLSDDGAAKLADLGLAILLDADRPQTPTALAGTVAYMAPEQAHGTVDHRSDIYSLGATFYHLVTGQFPFTGASRAEVLRKHAAEMPAAPHELVESLPETASEVILKMMAKNPADRFPSYDELKVALAELDEALNGPHDPHNRNSSRCFPVGSLENQS